jgi:hypothetical protein
MRGGGKEFKRKSPEHVEGERSGIVQSAIHLRNQSSRNKENSNILVRNLPSPIVGNDMSGLKVDMLEK